MRPKPILVGNSFPLPYVRRRIVIEPQPPDAFPRGAEIHSFWGHENTLAAANAFFGEDLTPKSARPALSLSENLLPMLDGLEFRECWVLSPNYAAVGRPALGEEVSAVKIKSWTLLKITWE